MTQETLFAIEPADTDLSSIPAAPASAGPDISREAEASLNESGRRPTQAETILAMLRAGTCTNHQLSLVSLRYGARLYELRQLGHDIEVEQVDATTYTYTLKD